MNPDDLKLLPIDHPMLKVLPEEFDDWDNAENFCFTLFRKQLDLGGIGLSANQVGLNAAVFTMGTGKDGKQWYIINPDVITVSEECDTMEEGCLSAPGLMLKVTRPTKISVSYQNTDGDPVLEEFDGIWARVFLHEYDHMLGQNFLQRVSKLKLDRALKKYKKLHKKGLFNDVIEQKVNYN